MDLMKFLTEASALPGIPGYERTVAEYVAEAFRPLCDEVAVDAMSNVVARARGEGPRIMVCAHDDEIGLMVRAIEEDGSIRVTRVGGVDPRILPSSVVTVLTRGGAIPGIVGAKPPHLLSAEDMRKVVTYDDLYVDVGYPADEVKRRVRVGDVVLLTGPTIELADGRAAGKTMDDRACVLSMLVSAELMRRVTTSADVYYVATTEEETGSLGASTAGYRIDPDIAIALDVTHAPCPGGDKNAPPLDKLALTVGPNIHPELLKRMKDVAKKNGVPFAMEVAGGPTGTDAWATQIVRAGVPSVLISVPLKYMHTTVETVRLDTIREAGRLLALFIEDIARGWEDIKWY